jgi:hypothetical protein
MTPEEIFRELSKRHEEPRVRALEAALERRAEVAPLLLAEIDRLLAQFEEISEKATTDRQYVFMIKKALREPSPLFYGFLLAAEWKQTEAYSRYVELLRWPLAGLPNLLSEMVYDTQGARVMAEFYNGDPAPLFTLLLDETGSESIRFWQWRTLILLVARGALDLDTLRRFLVWAFEELEQEPEKHVWVGWEAVIIYFGLDDLIPLVEQAHAVQRIRDRTIEDFRADYAYARAHPDQPIKGDAIVPFKGLWPEVDWAVANRKIP